MTAARFLACAVVVLASSSCDDNTVGNEVIDQGGTRETRYANVCASLQDQGYIDPDGFLTCLAIQHAHGSEFEIVVNGDRLSGPNVIVQRSEP